MNRTLLGLVFLAACGGSDPPPSCAQAMDHYYGAGCSYFDTSTNPPTPIAETQEVGLCQTLATAAPANCHDELDGWLVCVDHVPDHSSTNADCDCSSSYMLLLECR
jgi:hypothetical protein